MTIDPGRPVNDLGCAVVRDSRRAQRPDIGNGQIDAVTFPVDPKTPLVERRPFLRTELMLGKQDLLTCWKILPNRLSKQMRVGDFDPGKISGHAT